MIAESKSETDAQNSWPSSLLWQQMPFTQKPSYLAESLAHRSAGGRHKNSTGPFPGSVCHTHTHPACYVSQCLAKQSVLLVSETNRR